MFASPALNLVLGLLLASGVAYAAYRTRTLSVSGAIAAAAEGTFIFGFGGLVGAALLLAFFISSSALSRAFTRRKARFAEKFSKGAQRDASQVLANGGLAAGFTILHGLFPGQSWPWIGFAGSLAAVTADTWATELGVLSRTPPRLITTGRAAEPGDSGAVSLAGILAALGGAALIALLACLLYPLAPDGVQFQGPVLLFFAIISLSGVAGSLLDSFLGATVQAIYYCPSCDKETERHPLHSCGTPATLKRGWTWLNNDWVNAACSLCGAGLALAVLLAIPGWVSPAQIEAITDQGGSSMSFPIFSTSFEEGGAIPPQFTCTGENRSPNLSWRDLPAGTHSLALITEDTDAPGGTFIHWVLYNLPPTLVLLPEGLGKDAPLPNGATQGLNDFRRRGYDGPCPPPGPTHRYYFILFALDSAPTLPLDLTAAQLRKAMKGHILAEANWVGKFAR
ncbi:MAG TPA: YbhB/YbcL family Raf kinase inhibitor-like protein [Anaerolineaceae bacterium]|nr:YbhB/YbcL family Raf kinase inhibitor-like protein [Anaerolineaceae bacterium]